MQIPSFAKLDVLVVDPSPHMGALIGQMLRHLKVRRVDEVQSSDAAAVLLQSHRFGAIMLNDVLTPMSGVTVVKALRAAKDARVSGRSRSTTPRHAMIWKIAGASSDRSSKQISRS